MPPEELERRTQQIVRSIEQLEQVMTSDTERLKKVETLSKLATGGKKPDYDKLTDQELRDMFDVGIKSTTINNLPDGLDPESGVVTNQHPHSVIGVMEAGLTSATMSREQLVTAVDDLLKHNNYNIHPMVLAEAQIMMISAGSAEMDGKVEKVMFDNMNLETEEGEGYKNEEVREQLKQLKAQSKTFGKTVEDTSTSIVQGALQKQLGAAQGKSPQEVSSIIEHAKGRMNATDMSGGTKSLAKVKDQKLDLSGANLKGVDLSRSDLTGLKIDPKTLSQAKGVEQVRGIDPNVKGAALTYQKIDKLEAELDKLKNPGILDRIKAIRHGGIEGAKKDLINKIDKAKEDIIQRMDSAMSETLQKQNQESIEKLGHRQDELAPGDLAYREAEKQRNAAATIQAFAEGPLGDGLSKEGRQELQTIQEKSQKVMNTNEKAHLEHDKNDLEIEALKKNVSVRESLGSKVKTEPEGPKVGTSVKM
ncbi:hypothetical protein DES53_107181 [Roseimicrobium gellanilyticum]|uniref:Pentapeptide repeat protein n=1 Tax=Roseimicrobium gellanilyticum TaxID=748857 RepID=A0A366HH05_9BACT|nr:hypothetical protein [Roseimicrobium gellanilyticum]RBP41350.1 hypothetical protein DES53_107181 [Roseimicrobium gellanilyticum]